MSHPRWHTQDGKPVHERTADHRKGFAKRFGVLITNGVGTMTCAAIFAVIAVAGLPQAWEQSFAGGHFTPLPLVQWLAQTFLQLVLLSIIIVGQNAQAEASDARAAKTFEDGEKVAGWLDLRTEGGLTDVLNEVKAGRADFANVLGSLRALVAQPVGEPAAQDGGEPVAGDGS